MILSKYGEIDDKNHFNDFGSEDDEYDEDCDEENECVEEYD